MIAIILSISITNKDFRPIISAFTIDFNAFSRVYAEGPGLSDVEGCVGGSNYGYGGGAFNSTPMYLTLILCLFNIFIDVLEPMMITILLLMESQEAPVMD